MYNDIHICQWHLEIKKTVLEVLIVAATTSAGQPALTGSQSLPRDPEHETAHEIQVDRRRKPELIHDPTTITYKNSSKSGSNLHSLDALHLMHQ